MLPGVASAGSVELKALRLDSTSARTELVLSLSAPADHSLFSLTRPDRIVVDVDHAGLKAVLPAGQGVVASLRSGMHDGNLRLVLDLNAHATPRSFLRQGSAGPELVIDLYPAGVTPDASPATVAPMAVAVTPPPSTPERSPAAPAHSRDIVVAIDDGHGAWAVESSGRTHHPARLDQEVERGQHGLTQGLVRHHRGGSRSPGSDSRSSPVGWLRIA